MKWRQRDWSSLPNSLPLKVGTATVVFIHQGGTASIILIIKILLWFQQDPCQDEFLGCSEHSAQNACLTPSQPALMGTKRWTWVRWVNIFEKNDVHSINSQTLKLKQGFYNLNTGNITIYLAGHFYKKSPFVLWTSCILGKLLLFLNKSKKTSNWRKLWQRSPHEGTGDNRQ